MPLVLDVTLDYDKECKLRLAYQSESNSFTLVAIAFGEVPFEVWWKSHNMAAEALGITTKTAFVNALIDEYPAATDLSDLQQSTPTQSLLQRHVSVPVYPHHRSDQLIGSELRLYWLGPNVDENEGWIWKDSITSVDVSYS